MTDTLEAKNKVAAPESSQARPAMVRAFDPLRPPSGKPQSYYDEIKRRFAEERDLRVGYRPEGLDQYVADLESDPNLARYEADPHAAPLPPRAAVTGHTDVLCIGGGFSGLITSVRLIERGVTDIRVVERGSDFGGAWFWNRYPGIACDTPSYDYVPLLDEMGKVPPRYFASGEYIRDHCQEIARNYGLYDRALFQTTVTSTVWDEQRKLWRIRTDRGDDMTAQFVVVANGTLSQPKLSKIKGMDTFKGYSFHTSRFDYHYTGDDLSKLRDKTVGIIGTGSTAVQIIPRVGAAAKALYVFQRTPSPIDIRDDRPTDPDWAAALMPGWQRARREEQVKRSIRTPEELEQIAALPREEKIRRQENLNIEHMMRIHRRIEDVVTDKPTAEALKPWYMHRCKRPVYDDMYLQAFNLPQVHLVDTKGKGITEINEDGPVYDGKTYKLDLLIYATGFVVQKTGIYNDIRGVGGVELNEKYADGIRTVFGVHSHGYPNMFILGGYQASFQFNLTNLLQSQAEYIANCIRQVREAGFRTIDPKPDTEQWWVDEVIANRGKTNRNKECTPGYYNFEGGDQRRQDGNYMGTYKQYCEYLTDFIQHMDQKFNLERAA